MELLFWIDRTVPSGGGDLKEINFSQKCISLSVLGQVNYTAVLNFLMCFKCMSLYQRALFQGLLSLNTALKLLHHAVLFVFSCFCLPIVIEVLLICLALFSVCFCL